MSDKYSIAGGKVFDIYGAVVGRIDRNGKMVFSLEVDGLADLDRPSPVVATKSLTGQIRKTLDGAAFENTLKIQPSSVILPASVAGWSVTGDAVLTTTTSTYNGRSVVRMSSTTGAAAGYPKIRRRIPVEARTVAHGRIEIPVFIPYGLAVGEITITVSSDEPTDPPINDPANRASWILKADQFRRGQWQIITIDPSATQDTSTRTGQGWIVSGTPNMAALKYIDIYVYFGGTNAGTAYVDFSDICAAGYATPYVMIGFDGAGYDESHIEYVSRRLNKYGLKAVFSVQGQIPTAGNAGQRALIAKLKADGHEFSNEGMNHTNYVNSPATLSADIDEAIANFEAIGITTQNSGIGQIFTAPQNSLNSLGSGLVGLDTLRSKGFRYVRSGDKYSHITPSTVGPDGLFGVCPFGVGVDYVHTQAGVAKYLDAAELHGTAIMLLFHGIVANGATGTQTDAAVFNAIIDDIGQRIAQGRMINGTPSMFLDDYKDATGYQI